MVLGSLGSEVYRRHFSRTRIDSLHVAKKHKKERQKNSWRRQCPVPRAQKACVLAGQTDGVSSMREPWVGRSGRAPHWPPRRRCCVIFIQHSPENTDQLLLHSARKTVACFRPGGKIEDIGFTEKYIGLQNGPPFLGILRITLMMHCFWSCSLDWESPDQVWAAVHWLFPCFGQQCPPLPLDVCTLTSPLFCVGSVSRSWDPRVGEIASTHSPCVFSLTEQRAATADRPHVSRPRPFSLSSSLPRLSVPLFLFLFSFIS